LQDASNRQANDDESADEHTHRGQSTFAGRKGFAHLGQRLAGEICVRYCTSRLSPSRSGNYKRAGTPLEQSPLRGALVRLIDFVALIVRRYSHRKELRRAQPPARTSFFAFAPFAAALPHIGSDETLSVAMPAEAASDE
jgi:hypothetical protein